MSANDTPEKLLANSTSSYTPTDQSKESLGELIKEQFDSIPTALLFFIIGLSGIALNCVVGSVIKKCELTFTTTVLMISQCSANIIVLVPLTVYSPLLMAKGSLYNYHSFWHRIPGSLINGGGYLTFCLQTMMGINRAVAIGFFKKEKVIFSKKLTMTYWMLALVYAGVAAGACFHPCCQYQYVPFESRWAYNGYAAPQRAKLGLLTTSILYTICVLSYVTTLIRLKHFRRGITNKNISKDSAKQDMKVLFTFLVTAVVWFLATGTFMVVYFIPWLRGTWLTVFSDVQRYVMFMCDPIVYTVMMKKMRQQMRKTFLNKSTAVTPLNTTTNQKQIAIKRNGHQHQSNPVAMSQQEPSKEEIKIRTAGNTNKF